jgi:predicted ATPase/GAF domain-containing protein
LCFAGDSASNDLNNDKVDEMVEFPGYSHLETVHAFPWSTVFRAQREIDQLPVIIKSFKKPISPQQQNTVKEQLIIQRRLGLMELKPPLELIWSSSALVFKDDGEMFLSVILLHQNFDLSVFLSLAVRLCRSLNRIHSHHIILNDLRPQNILINDHTKNVTFTGLSARLLPQESGQHVRPICPDEDEFLYTAPEQTGRINWPIDQRSDLYGLGVLFYQLVTGELPFNAGDPVLRIHAHVAAPPPDPTLVQTDLPPILSRIILKLLSKSAEERYQSAFGLLQDLENCRSQYRRYRQIESFEPARQDNVEQFMIPSKLYGARENVVTLMESYNRVRSGSVEMMLIKGKAGMGKTSLVNELIELVHQKGGTLAYGRCGKQYRDTPYYPLTRAFQAVVRRLITDEKDRIDRWKAQFLKSLGRNGQMVIDFIPEMEAIIGPQPKVPKLDPEETQNRLIYIFKRFFQTFTLDGKPLVIFLDSFHWVDVATIQLLQSALSDVTSRYLMLLIAYQEDLLVHAHTVSIALDEIRHSGATIGETAVNPLTLEDICLLIEDTLSFKQDYRILAETILNKTKGNPYFVKLLLQTYYENALIFFDANKGQWRWDLKKLRKAGIADNVEALLSDKIQNLAPTSREILKLASCIGTQFSLQLVALAAEFEIVRLKELLEPCRKAGLVQPVASDSRNLDDVSSYANQLTDSPAEYWQFSHSRVLHTAYNLLDDSQKSATHLKLGRILQQNTPPEQLEQNVFTITNHLNESIDLIQHPAERQALARLNLIAGKKSKSIAAFETAWKYFCKGSSLLGEDSWENEYDLTKELYLKRAACAYFIGHAVETEPVFDLLLNHSKTLSEKVEVINLQLNLFTKNHQHGKAIQVGLQALESLFSESIPPNDAEISIVSQMKLQDIQDELEYRGLKNLLFLPLMTDPDKNALMDLLAGIIPAAYEVRKNLWILLTLKMIEVSLACGNTNSSAYGYMNYAVILCSGLQDYSSGFTIGRLALDLNNKFNHHQLLSQLSLLFGSYVNHWNDNAKENLPYLRRSYQAGIDHGDYVSAANSIDFQLKTGIMTGIPLEEIQRESKKYQDFADQFNSRELKLQLEVSRLMVRLRQNDQNDTLIPDPAETNRLLTEVESCRNATLTQWFYLVLAQLYFYSYDFKQALDFIKKSDQTIAGYSQLAVPEHYFFYALIIAENYHDFNEESKKRHWDLLKSHHQKIVKLAGDCPANFAHKSLLIAAKMAALSSNTIKAGDLFDEAIKSALQNGFIQHAALSCELTARFYLGRNKVIIAAAYLREACHNYLKWGATAKLRCLESTYPTLLEKRRRFDDTAPLLEPSVSEELETEFVIETSQMISKEIVLEKIIEKLLQILLSKTAAERTAFLIQRDDRLVIIAEASTEQDPTFRFVDIPLEESEHLATSVIFYVIRTRKMVLLDDASQNNMFAYNEYITKHQPKAILCIPVLNHGQLTGVVYLENPSTPAVFSARQAERLSQLIAQVAISVENAILYHSRTQMTEQLRSSKAKLEKRIQVLEKELASNIF